MSSNMSPNTPAKKQYEFPPQQDHIIQPSEDDVAISMLGNRVYVSAPERKQFQHVWLWESDYTDDTTTSFKPGTQGPGVSTQSPLPAHTELQPHDMATEMLEIGLVFASDPSRFHDEVKGQTSRSKSRQIARDKRGIMTRDHRWFRAYIKVTDYIQSQAKVSVGCLLFDGHLRHITTEIGHVFFYKEFYPGASIENVKEKSAYMRQAIKFYSAKIKRPQPKPGAGETASMASQALVPEVAVAGDPMDPVQMEDQRPPYDNNDSVSNFLAFDKNITLDDEDMANLIEIVQPQIRDAVQLQPELIRTVHEVMCVCRLGEQTLGQLFPHSALVFFLDTCHEIIELPCGIGSIIEGVYSAFRSSQRYAAYTIGSTLSSTSSNRGKRNHSDIST